MLECGLGMRSVSSQLAGNVECTLTAQRCLKYLQLYLPFKAFVVDTILQLQASMELKLETGGCCLETKPCVYLLSVALLITPFLPSISQLARLIFHFELRILTKQSQIIEKR